jgi:hypothetical protein
LKATQEILFPYFSISTSGHESEKVFHLWWIWLKNLIMTPEMKVARGSGQTGSATKYLHAALWDS